MTKTIIILLVLFSLCSGGDNDLCTELMNRDEDERKWFIRKICKQRCQEIKADLKKEFDVRYKQYINDAQYHTKIDEIAIKDNLKKTEYEYEKRFGVSISDFELLTKRIEFYIGGHSTLEFTHYNKSSKYYLSRFSVTKTATGALVKYNRNEFIEPLVMELNINEWMDFIRVLYVSCINRWKKEYDNFFEDSYSPHSSWVGYVKQWKLEIFSLGKNEPDEYYGIKEYPPNWKMLLGTIDTIKSRMYRDAAVKTESQLKTDYQKRFGKPINDLELSTVNVYYKSAGTNGSPIHLLATRTTTGGFVECQLLSNDWFAANLDKNEWLDFIRDLYKSTKGWKNWNDSISFPSFTGFDNIPSSLWSLDTRSLDKQFLGYSGFTASSLTSQPNGKEFIRVMINMAEKVRLKDKLNRK